MNEALLTRLSARIPSFIGGKRLAHTYAVERECAALGALFSRHPSLMTEEDVYKLRISALLHDITKEKSVTEHVALATKYRIPLTDYELASPKVLHAKTAPLLAADVINTELGMCLVDDTVKNAIYTHTTGAEQMTLTGKLLYLADYIEETRTFADCVTLRHAFYDNLDAVKDDPCALMHHLDTVMLLSFDMTIKDLLSVGALVHANTIAARNALLFALQ